MLCILPLCVSVAEGSGIQGCIVNSRPTWATRKSLSKTKQTKDSTGHLLPLFQGVEMSALPAAHFTTLPWSVLPCPYLLSPNSVAAAPHPSNSFVSYLQLEPHTFPPYTPLPSSPEFQGTGLSLPALFGLPWGNFIYMTHTHISVKCNFSGPWRWVHW